jgi:tRNA pseudouridine55 synthase
MDGILVINKPAGISSARVVGRVKRLLQARKVGHTGTLDPFARGVVVCCINQATRLAPFLMRSPKTYEGVLTLGIETDTQDATGKVIAQRDGSGFSAETLLRVFQRYTGPYHQSPPAYSALKHEGVPLYVLARRGQPVQKAAREVSIFRIRLLAAEPPRVRFEVTCSAGTYIRTLCADIGRELGCGGHLSELIRLKSGGFTLREALTPEELEDLTRCGEARNAVIPMARALPEMAAITAGPPLLEKVRYGRPLRWTDLDARDLPGATPTQDSRVLKLIDSQGELVAVLKQRPGAELLEYGCVFVRPERG